MKPDFPSLHDPTHPGESWLSSSTNFELLMDWKFVEYS